MFERYKTFLMITLMKFLIDVQYCKRSMSYYEHSDFEDNGEKSPNTAFDTETDIQKKRKRSFITIPHIPPTYRK